VNDDGKHDTRCGVYPQAVIYCKTGPREGKNCRDREHNDEHRGEEPQREETGDSDERDRGRNDEDE